MEKTRHPLYSTWRGIKARCNDKNHKNYRYYGGKGIKLCEEWEDFWKFAEFFGEKPKGHSIDRHPDSDGNYEPGNVRWSSQSEQIKNQKVRSDNSSGIKGVSWFWRTNRWFVYINHENKRVALGYYEDFFEACCVRKSAESFIWNGIDPYGHIESLKKKLKSVINKGRFDVRRNKQK